MARLEYKYYIPDSKLDDLRRDILPFLKFDPYMLRGGRKEYTVKSVYLDSLQLHTYQEKESGVKERNKYRIRGYNQPNEDSIVFLEIKRKDQDYISKDRAKLPYRNLERFLQTKDFSLLSCTPQSSAESYKASARNFLYYYSLYQLRPVVVVTYDREAFECKFGTDLRVTFDKNIRTRPASSVCDIFPDEKMTPALKGMFVLEVKFSKIVPSWIPRVLNRHNIFRDSASKYLMSINSTINNSLLYI